MTEKKTITQEEVQQALKKFLSQGGLIKRLPDEVASRSPLVGAKYAVYESLSEHVSEQAAGSEAVN